MSAKSSQCRQRLATAATFVRSCVAQALRRVGGLRHSLHAWAQYGEYNEDLIFLCSIITVHVKKFKDNSFIEISMTVLQKCKKSSQYY